MNRINTLFQSKDKDIFSIYFCAGACRTHSTQDILQALQSNGVDMVEIGIPFSDPIADGAVIQAAATQAIHNGMTLRKLFEELRDVRNTGITMPLVLMGYLNPIMHYGIEAFCKEAAACGIDGIIIPDLPFADYIQDFKAATEKHGLSFIMLITPETSDERIHLIDANTNGFIYMVSSASTTGAQDSYGEDTVAYFRRINAMPLRNPRMIGFGISNHATFTTACENANGAIIGSRYVSLLDKMQDPDRAIKELRSIINI